MKPHQTSSSRFLWNLYRPRMGWLTLAFVFLALTWLSAAALLAISGWFITACALAGLGVLTNLNIFTPSSIIRALAILRTAGRYAERVVGHEAILRVLADLRVRAFRAVASQPAKVTNKARYADLVNRITADVDTLDGVPLRVIGPFVAAVLTWIAVMAVTYIWGGLAVTAVVGGGGLLTFGLSVWCAHQGRRRGEALIKARTEQRIALSDYLSGLAELIAYRQTDQWTARLTALEKEQSSRLMQQEMFASLSEHAVQALTACMTLAVIFLTWNTQDPLVVALLALMTLGLNEALGMLPGAFWRMGESDQAAKHLMELEDAPTEEPTQSSAVVSRAVSTKSRSIRIQQLECVRQPMGSQLFSIKLQAGQPLVVYGRSGSGKTSLLSTLAGELTANQGHVWLDDLDLLALADDARYQHIKFMSQHDQLLDVSIGEFLSLGQGTLSETQMRLALSDVDLLETLQQTDEGLQYRIGVGGSRISGGQARRLQLAALRLCDPDLLLLDEPFRGLQKTLVHTIIQRLAPWLEQRCCVIVTHDPQSLPAHWPRLQWPVR
jgi:ATP-binding cassette, subfamily C, bacterial CydC